MSTQITVRLPDDLVEFLDDEIRGGHSRSRAALVTKAITRLRRDTQTLRDIERIKAQPYDEFDELHAWAGKNRPRLDD